MISQGVYLYPGTNDYTNTGFPLLAMSIYSADMVWIAKEAFTYSVVKIANRYNIETRSLATGNRRPGWLAAGMVNERIMKFDAV